MSWSKPLALAASIRAGEVLILQGAPLLGVAFAISPVTMPKLVTTSIFIAASFLLVAHIFTLNDWADFSRGVHHPDGAIARLERHDIRPPLLLFFSFLLLLASLLVFYFLSQECLFFAAIIAALGIFYSHPWLNVKSIPVFSSLLHLAGGLAHFLLGYVLFSPLDQRGGGIAIFFALIFTAGHLNQEIRDYEVDQQTGARTNAVTFGKRANFVVALILFVASYGCLLLLASRGILPGSIAILALVACLIHIVLSFRTLRLDLTSAVIRRFQAQYRFIYFVIGLVLLTTLLRG